MHVRARLAAAALVASLGVAGCSGGEAGGDRRRLTVFAATSLSPALTAIAAAFERERPGTKVETNFSGTPRLLAQIRHGAPADVFASADEATMARAVDGGLVVPPATVVARNRLVIVVRRGNPRRIAGLADLADSRLLVGLCAPAVPAGRYARMALARAGVDVSPATSEPNVKAVLTKLSVGEIDAGIVYRSDVTRAGDVEAVPIAPEHDVVASYPMARTTEARNPVEADAFVAFAGSARARRILADAGFLEP